jgi:prepilin-type N-terminal cleavage/methylation domain-containing protein
MYICVLKGYIELKWRKTMRKQKGFSLIELLIVVAIILIIAAIAIPNLLRSRIAANEASAVGSLRTINTAEVSYASTYPNIGFATSLAVLGPGATAGATSTSANAALLDNVLGNSTCTSTTCPKSGYNFYITATAGTAGAPTSTYSSNANPLTVDQTGKRYFYSDASGVIRYNTTATSTSADAALQ